MAVESNPSNSSREIANSATAVTSARRRIHRWSSLRSNSSASVPATGRKVRTVRIKVCCTSARHPQQQGSEDHRAYQDPGCIGAYVSRPRVTQPVTGLPGDVCDAIDCAVDHTLIHNAPQNLVRNPNEGPDNCGGVQFVHEVFSAEQFVGRSERGGRLLRRFGAANIEPPGEEKTDQAGDPGRSQESLQQFGRAYGSFRGSRGRFRGS